MAPLVGLAAVFTIAGLVVAERHGSRGMPAGSRISGRLPLPPILSTDDGYTRAYGIGRDTVPGAAVASVSEVGGGCADGSAGCPKPGGGRSRLAKRLNGVSSVESALLAVQLGDFGRVERSRFRGDPRVADALRAARRRASVARRGCSRLVRGWWVDG